MQFWVVGRTKHIITSGGSLKPVCFHVDGGANHETIARATQLLVTIQSVLAGVDLQVNTGG